LYFLKIFSVRKIMKFPQNQYESQKYAKM